MISTTRAYVQMAHLQEQEPILQTVLKKLGPAVSSLSKCSLISIGSEIASGFVM